MSGDPMLTTVFVDARATKRRLRRSRLLVVAGPDKGKELVIERERVTVGRSLVCDLVLGDKAVSGSHFEVEASEAGVLVRDLGSTNGTWCGELRVKEAWLKPGLVIRAGQSQLRYESAEGDVEIDLSVKERFHELVGQSVRMREIFAILEKIAPTDLTALIRGETGTGKELAARAIHRASRRAKGPLVVQDCSAIPRDLIESTLFGHERGSFTGAGERHRGCFEQADGGTIFLDEIGDMSRSLQAKLLRFLEDGSFSRVGGNDELKVNVRLLAATNRDIIQAIRENQFREDLYHRLNVVQFRPPALRERGQDVCLLAEHFLKHFCGSLGKPVMTLAKPAAAKLLAHHWPGNVRELRNVLERAVILAPGPQVEPAHLPDFDHETKLRKGDTPAGPLPDSLDEALAHFEKQLILAALEQNHFSINKTAERLKVTRHSLRYRMLRLNLNTDGVPDGDTDVLEK